MIPTVATASDNRTSRMIREVDQMTDKYVGDLSPLERIGLTEFQVRRLLATPQASGRQVVAFEDPVESDQAVLEILRKAGRIRAKHLAAKSGCGTAMIAAAIRRLRNQGHDILRHEATEPGEWGKVYYQHQERS